MSAYNLNVDSNDYTSWKFRGDVECKEILDYIFASRDRFRVEAVLGPASEAEIGLDRLPSFAFASDHLSLVTDLKVVRSDGNNRKNYWKLD